MLDTDSGYEGKFDFAPRGGPPEIAYLLATVPRTGSSWFSHLLWETGCLGAPLEYLNFERAGPYYFASHSPDQQLRLWRSVLRRRTSPNGVFGVKCFPMQLQALEEANPRLLSEVLSTVLPRARRPRIVFLERKDRIAHAVSYARAIVSGVWRSEQESEANTEVEYSEIAVDRARKLIEDQLAAWERMFADLGVEPLRLSYEDAVAAPSEAVETVADHLGVRLDPDAAIAVPAVRKQAAADSAKWLERYGR